MDILAHALYGATLFSRTGLAGGARGPIDADGRPRSFDWTVWAAFGFGILPDVISIGVGMLMATISGIPFIYADAPYVQVMYRLTHALVIAILGSLLIRTFWKPLFLPSLAWPLHTIMDVFTHGGGRFRIFLYFHIPGLKFRGLDWWTHPWIIAVYWGLLILLWLGIHFWRRRAARIISPA